MREVKFRARHKETGEWFCGDSETVYQVHHLVPLSTFWQWVQLGVLDPETMGEYTGFKDKSNREVYEKDIFCDEINRHFEIYWHTETASFWARLISTEDEHYRIGTNFAVELVVDGEVIGNTTENPELLRKEE